MGRRTTSRTRSWPCGQAAIAERIITGRRDVKPIGERLRGAGGQLRQADLCQGLARLREMELI
jgi:hypothetical protein